MLICSLESYLSLDLFCNPTLRTVMRPIGLRTIMFAIAFDQSLENLTLPIGLPSIMFWVAFN